jgi:hypothetical protein
MPRDANQHKLPSKIYFIQTNHCFLGPYTSRPTKVMKDESYEGYTPTLITLVKDNNDSYINENMIW